MIAMPMRSFTLAGRAVELELREDVALDALRDAVQADERRVAEGRGDVGVDAGHVGPFASRRRCGLQPRGACRSESLYDDGARTATTAGCPLMAAPDDRPALADVLRRAAEQLARAGRDRRSAGRCRAAGRPRARHRPGRGPGRGGARRRARRRATRQPRGPRRAPRGARAAAAHHRPSPPFRHLELRVGPGVFVPRPETEIVAQLAIDALRAAASPAPIAVDLGTGQRRDRPRPGDRGAARAGLRRRELRRRVPLDRGELRPRRRRQRHARLRRPRARVPRARRARSPSSSRTLRMFRMPPSRATRRCASSTRRPRSTAARTASTSCAC